MRARVLLAPLLALLAATWGTELQDGQVIVWKCCDVYEMLSADGKSCVDAEWSGNFSIARDADGDVVPPLDSAWLRRWLPPGFPLDSISSVYSNRNAFTKSGDVFSVNESTLWHIRGRSKEPIPKGTIVFVTSGYFIRMPSRPSFRYTDAFYCLDAALRPLGPFAMQSDSECKRGKCVYSCCGDGKLVKNNERKWKCENDAKSYGTSNAIGNSHLPTTYHWRYCGNRHLLPSEKRYTHRSPHVTIHTLFSSWNPCFDFFRSSNGTLSKGLFYCDSPRVTRGVYWLLRPLCILSASLLLASLATVACDKSMRRTIYGRCLAIHATCLLAFNIGQIAYYTSISDRLDKIGKEEIPPDLEVVCKYFALSMYFVLTASRFWLTPLCASMATGFRLRMARCNKGSGKRFLVISAFAWGLPALLTIMCSVLFTQPKSKRISPWYTPSFMETRVCYNEPLNTISDLPSLLNPMSFIKSGTALFYYGPVCCLVASNVICLVLTLRKVQDLKQGNSVLRRVEDQIPLVQELTKGNNPFTAHTTNCSAKSRECRKGRDTTADAKTMKLYIKMVLTTGGFELLSELIMWFMTHNNLKTHYIYLISLFHKDIVYSHYDKDLAYRAAGYVTDFFRAVVVTWLAAPEGGYLGLIKRGLRRGKRDRKSARAGNGGRRKHNVA